MEVCQIAVLPEEERHRVLVEWNATRGCSIRQIVACTSCLRRRSSRTPDAVAVVHEDTQLSYGELNAQANRLAHYLRELGVKPDARVAICVERSLEMIVGVAGGAQGWRCLCAAGSGYPVERLAYMLEDSAPVAVLTHGQCRHRYRILAHLGCCDG